MRLALILTCATAAPALADDHPHAVAARSTTIGISGHAAKQSSLDEAGGGPSLELALGRRRWQYFAELGLAYAVLGPSVHRTEGVQASIGIGARWLARSYTVVGNGGIEMTLEAFGGGRRSWWRGGDRHLRPELGFGVGWQMRFFHTQTTLRTTARVFFTPPDDSMVVACRGTCGFSSAISSGLAVATGFSW